MTPGDFFLKPILMDKCAWPIDARCSPDHVRHGRSSVHPRQRLISWLRFAIFSLTGNSRKDLFGVNLIATLSKGIPFALVLAVTAD